MRVTMILPALTEATDGIARSIKYSLFPPLGLATLAGYLAAEDDVQILDEHVQRLDLENDRPDLVVIQVYVTSARRAYRIADSYRARGVHVALGGLHVTALPDEAAPHADTVFLGPGEDTWPVFLQDFRRGRPLSRYASVARSLHGVPPVRRDLIRRNLYLAPNSIVVSRGCPYHCDFCYKDAFYAGGRSYYTQRVDAALAEIERLPGRHLFFLDDHLFADRRFAVALMDGMRGLGRVWQAAATVRSVLDGDLLERAARSGLRSLFVGFETVDQVRLAAQRKAHNLDADYDQAVRRIHEVGAMVNASFVFGLDGESPDVFTRTVDWALAGGIETATFHILTPYPGTRLHERMAAEGRILHREWDRYDTRHVVHTPQGMTVAQLEEGYRHAYRDFYRWGSIWRAAATKPRRGDRLRHLTYTGAWKKLEPAWDLLIRSRHVLAALPLLESTLTAFGTRPTARRLRVTGDVAGASGEAAREPERAAGLAASAIIEQLPEE